MATQHYQEQEQDDLMAAFDAPRKEVRRSKLRRRRQSKNVRTDSDLNEVYVGKLESNSHWQAEVSNTLKESMFYDDRAKAADEAIRDVNERNLGLSDEAGLDSVGRTVPDNDEFSVLPEEDEGFSSESFYVILEEIKNLVTTQADVLRKLESFDDVFEKFFKSLDFVYEIPKYEQELKYLSALVLLCWGGSWTMVAGIIGAVEVFGTQGVVEECVKVGTFLISEEVEENDLMPEEIKETFRNAALQFALMIAVVTCPSVAEICITIAFACKFSPLVSCQEIMKDIVSSEFDNMESEDFLGQVDPEWFDLLSLFGCNIASVILFGCFPRLMTAMYMGYLGVCLFSDAINNGVDFFIPFVTNFGVFDESMWKQKTTQYYVWAFVAIMAVWQAMYGYCGYFEFVSWSMFLYPAVHVFNTFFGEKSPESKKTE